MQDKDVDVLLDYAAMVQTLLDASVVRQITEETLLIARQQAENSAGLKDQFLATMSHEIRTPMNGIIGMTTLLQDTRLDERQSELVRLLRTSTSGLLTLLNDILDFSKLEAEKIELEEVTFNPRTLCDDILMLFAAQANGNDTDLAVFADSSVPEQLVADEGRLRQIMTNLVSNAVKFTSGGVVSLFLRMDGGQLFLRVEDTGCGIATADHRTIFQPFEQTSSAHSKRTLVVQVLA